MIADFGPIEQGSEVVLHPGVGRVERAVMPVMTGVGHDEGKVREGRCRGIDSEFLDRHDVSCAAINVSNNRSEVQERVVSRGVSLAEFLDPALLGMQTWRGHAVEVALPGEALGLHLIGHRFVLAVLVHA